MSDIRFTRGYGVPTGANAEYAGLGDCGCGCNGAPGGCGGSVNGFGAFDPASSPIVPWLGLAFEAFLAAAVWKSKMPRMVKGALLIRSAIKLRDGAAKVGVLKALPGGVQDTLYEIPEE